jgi:hypothetical protein
MSRAARFMAVLLVGLGLLTWVGHVALTRTTRRWFERDVELRARLAVSSAPPPTARRSPRCWPTSPATSA